RSAGSLAAGGKTAGATLERMGVCFRQVTCAPLDGFDAAAPDGVVIGIIGENGSGTSRLLALAAGERPASGSVERSGEARLLALNDPLHLEPASVLLIDHTFARQDRLVRERAAVALDRLRRAGATVLLVSHEDELLRRLADEIWWVHQGKLAGRGDPDEMLRAYGEHIAARLPTWGESEPAAIARRMRRGDGRAEVLRIETVGENGAPTMVWRSGELAVVRVTVRFHAAVEDPVVGMMIRTRIGLNVYGTNTELEKLKLGPCAAGDE